MADAQVVNEFTHKFAYLRAHPDKLIIDDLTECCKKNIRVAAHITAAIMGRLLDPATEPSNKLPILYLTDAIMKKVGGTYPEYFSKHLVAVVQRAVNEISPQERKKLGTLIKTWEERRLLPSDVLTQMSNVVAKRLAADTMLPPPQVVPPHVPYQPMGQPRGQPRGQPMMPPRAGGGPYAHMGGGMHPPQPPFYPMPIPVPLPVQPGAPPGHAMPQMAGQKRSSRFDAPPAPSSSSSSFAPPSSLPSFQDLVEVEMAALLSQLLSDLGGAQMTLGELQVSNPQLYRQMRQNAEVAARAKYSAAGLSIAAQGPADFSSGSGGGGGDKHPNHIRGFVSETPVLIDHSQLDALITSLAATAASAAGAEAGAGAGAGIGTGPTEASSLSGRLASDLQALYKGARKTAQLPAILFGPLPLAPSPAFVAFMQAAAAAPSVRRRKAAFKISAGELGRNPAEALKPLYAERPFRFEDGVRFRSQLELNGYIDAVAEKRRAALRAEQHGAILRRDWYQGSSSWVSNLGSSLKENDAGDGSGAGKAGAAAADDREFIVPADEYFTRCPVSKEVFETTWNEDEGEFMYRHAARVLVTAAADSAVFKLGRATSEADVRYVIAHKLLVVDEWVSSGRAASLTEAARRYEAMGRPSAAKDVERLRRAAGGEADEYVFVMLEHASK